MVKRLLFRNALLVIFGHVLFIVPLLFFSDGFFLRRVEFADKSVDHGTPTYKRAVILLVDALSFSFARRDTSLNESDYFSNKLTVFEDMLQSNDSHKYRLYKFIADPPTTTMQRIKALSTGGLSTFIEIAANFFSSEILEDSWVHQGSAVGNGVVALGDDTWSGLFPRSFKRTFLYPSFNVKDLDTVDNGVLQHLFDELESRDWSIVMAHFLGVDHCGHTYGRNHPEMARKLKQIDNVIRTTLSHIDNETVLFVLGDHGMTASGDHGGESELEVSSTLFVFAPRHNFSPSIESEMTVFQTDFIPTLSVLMGWPIPFSSVGSLIEDILINSPSQSLEEVLSAYRLNSNQLKVYYDKYFGNKSGESSSTLEKLYDSSISATQSALRCIIQSEPSGCESLTESAINAHKAFHKAVRESCESSWVKFNLTLVFGGMLGMALAILVNIALLFQIDSVSLPKLCFGILLMCSVMLQRQLIANDIVSTFVLNIILLLLLGYFTGKGHFLRSFSFFAYKHEVAMGMLFVPLMLGKFSNSYVIYEPFVILLLLNFFVIYRTIGVVAKILSSIPGKLWVSFVSAPITSQCIYSCCLLLILRFQISFVSCREEHGPTCEQVSFLTPLGSLLTDAGAYLSFRFLVTIASLFAMPVYFCHLASIRGNLKGRNLTSVLYSYGLYLAAICIVFDWIIQAGASKSNSALVPMPSLLYMFPRIVYGLVALIIVAFIFNPLIFASKSDSDIVAEHLESNNEIGEDGQIDPSNPRVMRTLYQFIKTKYERGTDPSVSDLYVFGLGSTISAGWQLVYACFTLLAVMLCGDGLSPAIASISLALMMLYKLEMSNGFSLVVALHLLQNLAFYITAHHATWTHIKWQAAFVGFDSVPDFFAIPGSLILTNTFAGNVIVVLSIPLFILWPVVEMNCLPSSASGGQKQKKDENTAECGFINQPKMLANPLVRICMMLILTTAIEVFVSSVAACFLRRHLMAFKIFVPRLIFSVISFAYNFFLFLVVACVPMYVLNRLKNWKITV